jgi:hypothetical protein
MCSIRRRANRLHALPPLQRDASNSRAPRRPRAGVEHAAVSCRRQSALSAARGDTPPARVLPGQSRPRFPARVPGTICRSTVAALPHTVPRPRRDSRHRAIGSNSALPARAPTLEPTGTRGGRRPTLGFPCARSAEREHAGRSSPRRADGQPILARAVTSPFSRVPFWRRFSWLAISSGLLPWPSSQPHRPHSLLLRLGASARSLLRTAARRDC